MTREEMGLPAARPRRRLDPMTEEILTILVDPGYPHAEKTALRDLLRARVDRPAASPGVEAV